MQGNEQQNRAIVWNTGPMLVLAGPGSGKTFTTVERVRYLIEIHKVDPSNILVITFTKAAARQMRSRFFDRIEEKSYPVYFGTFHAVFYHILKNSSRCDLGSILTEKEKREYLRMALSSIKKESAEQYAEREELEDGLLSEIGYLKNRGYMPPDFKSAYLEPSDFKRLFVTFQKLLREMGKLDLDDFAAALKHLFISKPGVLAKWQQRFSYLLIDEFQDINAVQYEVIKLLAGKKQNLFVVGDDDQAIYGFRGSDPSIMQQFVQDFPQAEKVILSVNYRSRPGIVSTAGRLIGENKERFTKPVISGRERTAAGFGSGRNSVAGTLACSAPRLPDKNRSMSQSWESLSSDHAVQICGFSNRREQMKALAAMMGQSLENGQSVAAIFRTNSVSAMLAEELKKAGVPFAMRDKTKSPYAHMVCKDLLAYLHFAKGSGERKYFFRIMNRPCRYISRQKIDGGRVEILDLLSAYRDRPYMRQIILKLQADITRLSKMDLYAAVNYIRKGMGYDAWLEKEMTGEKRKEALEMADFFQNSVQEFSTVEELQAHIAAYELSLKEAPKEPDTEGAAAELMTMHGAKGLEYDVVFLPDCNEGIVPHKKSAKGKEIEEERRMFYVGMTRAKERLFFSWVKGTKEDPGFLSRFLGELGYREPYRGKE